MAKKAAKKVAKSVAKGTKKTASAAAKKAHPLSSSSVSKSLQKYTKTLESYMGTHPELKKLVKVLKKAEEAIRCPDAEGSPEEIPALVKRPL